MELQLVDSVVPDNLNTEYLAEWIAYREEDLSKPMTPRAIKMLTKKLLQWSIPEQERMICNAIEMNWKGVYWVDPPKQQSSRQKTIEEDLEDRSWSN